MTGVQTCALPISALKPQPLSVLEKAGVKEMPGVLRFCDTLPDAVAAARAHLGKPAVDPAIQR